MVNLKQSAEEKKKLLVAIAFISYRKYTTHPSCFWCVNVFYIEPFQQRATEKLYLTILEVLEVLDAQNLVDLKKR